MHPPFPLAHPSVLNALVSYKESNQPPPHVLFTIIHLSPTLDASYFSYILHTGASFVRDLDEEVREKMVWRIYKKEKLIAEEEVGNVTVRRGKFVRLLELRTMDGVPCGLKKEFEIYKDYLIRAGVSKKKQTVNPTSENLPSKNLPSKNSPSKNSLNPLSENSLNLLSENPLNLLSENLPNPLSENLKKVIKPRLNRVDENVVFYSEVDYREYNQRKKRNIPTPPIPLLPVQKKKKFMNLTTCFNINKIEPQFEATNSKLRFQPLFLPNYITTKINTTHRMASSVKKPIKLTFIKFHDQIKPPTFCVMKKAGQRITFKKVPDVANYEVDSDENWIYEDGESIDSEDTESEEEASEDNEWIDKEGAVVTSMKYKKPEILCVDITIEYFKEFDESFMLLPLKRDLKFNDNLLNTLKERFQGVKNREDFCRTFAAEFNIVIGAVRQKVKDLKEQDPDK